MVYTNQDRLIDPVAEVRGSMPLFEWATERARQTRTIERQITDQEKAAAGIEVTLSETMEWKAAEEAKEVLADAKKDALDASAAVQDAKEEKKAAAAALRKVDAARELRVTKKKLKTLRTQLAETKGEVVRALVDGKVPSPLVADEPPAPKKARKGKA